MKPVRSGVGRVTVQPRELLALDLLGRLGAMNSQHFHELWGCSKHIGNRALRKLERVGFVRRHRVTLNDPSWFTLDKRALPTLERVYRDRSHYRTMKGLGRTNLPHLAGVARFLVLVLRASSQSKRAQVTRIVTEAELRRGASPGQVVPDAIVELETEAGVVRWCLEYDRSTESPTYVAQKKAAIYAARWESTPNPNWRVLCVVPSKRRMKALLKGAWTNNISVAPWRYAIEGRLNRTNVLTADAWFQLATNENGTGHLVHTSPLMTGDGRASFARFQRYSSPPGAASPRNRVAVPGFTSGPEESR